MNNSTLHNIFNIRGYNYQRTEYREGITYIHIKPKNNMIVCPTCNSKNVTTRGSIIRTIKTVPVALKKMCFLVITVPRLYCHDCLSLRYMDLKIADKNKSYTHNIIPMVITLFACSCITAIASILQLHWTIIKDICKSYLKKEFSKPDLRNVTMISIDEISIKKGHNYLTVVIDAKTGQPIYTGDGKGEDALEDFWKLLGPRRRKRITAVAIDMGVAYISAVKKNLPHAKIVFDHFHVIKLVNDRLNDLRKKVYASAAKNDQKILAGIKYVLLKGEENLDEKGKTRLNELLALNTPLTIGYILKEDLRQIWKKKYILSANKALKNWIKTARDSGEPILIQLAGTIEKHLYGILNWYLFKINSGRIEGINNKIKLVKRTAYGFHDEEFFKLLIMAILRSKQVLVYGAT
jgi:transposase